jgi:hypothetical protein
MSPEAKRNQSRRNQIKFISESTHQIAGAPPQWKVNDGRLCFSKCQPEKLPDVPTYMMPPVKVSLNGYSLARRVDT